MMRLVYCPTEPTSGASDEFVADFDLVRLRRHGAARSECAELADLAGPFSEIRYFVQKFVPRAQLAHDLGATARLLEPAGRTLVSIPPKSGRKPLVRILEAAYARVEAVRHPGPDDLVLCREPRPDAVAPPLPVERLRLDDPGSGRILELETRPGLFSFEAIDRGTRLLLEAVGPLAGEVLDVGCGCGVIGLVAAARGARATLVDTDARAVKFARANLGRNGLDAAVRLADGCEGLADRGFDLVLSNPPTHAGSATLRALFAGMARVCRPTGAVWLVVREHLNYEGWLAELGRCETLVTAAGYKVLRVTPSA